MEVIVIGAGFGGLGMGVALKKHGITNFLILERGPNVGGVWRDNQYPGCTCDVPSHLYSFSFAPYRRRDKRFPPQQEILEYLEDVACDYGLTEHLLLNTEVVAARFVDDEEKGGVWHVETKHGRQYQADFVVFAVGQLHRAKYPDIDGLEDFKGAVMHPARWLPEVEFAGKNVALIGTGSSAAQMLPSIADQAKSVTVYQRSPAWVLPKPSEQFGRGLQTLLRLPGAHQLYRTALHHAADMLLSPIPRSCLIRKAAKFVAKKHLGRQVQDGELIDQLMPKYPIGTKRILFDSAFYPALQATNVKLCTTPINRINATSIEDDEGTTVPADIIICATGFKASEFLVPMTVTGRGGKNLNEVWANGAEAFMGMAIPDFPNLFMIAGPNTFNPAGSNPTMKEYQIDFIMRGILWRNEMQARTVEVTDQAMYQYQVWLEKKMEKTIWAAEGGEGSWYVHQSSGKVTNPWPSTARAFERKLQVHPRKHFELAYDQSEITVDG